MVELSSGSGVLCNMVMIDGVLDDVRVIWAGHAISTSQKADIE